MITKNQFLSNYKRKRKKRPSNVPRLENSPQKKGSVQKVFEQSPKKPNSAKRNVIRVKLNTDEIVTAHVPGIKHNLQQHSIVLIRGGRCKDLIGVKYKPIRGVFDLDGVEDRISRKSKYGVAGKNK